MNPVATFSLKAADLAASMPTAVYVARDAGGLVIYVGMTGSLGTRFAAHQSADRWWRSAHTVVVEIHSGRAAAAAREAALIAEFDPPFNRSEKREQWARRRQELDDAFVDLFGQGLTLTGIRRHLGVTYAVAAETSRRLRAEGRIERRRPGSD